ncbi:MAG: HAD-IIIA family hydrolase, partial [Betaproteobacteria bacterium]|nr:HAD-IIIA family hydrolase [Betaproteobacteria bacterium]
VVVATNQSALGRGLFDMATLNAMHAKLHKLLAEKGGRLDAVFFCPHTPEDDCRCRKPQPGLFEQIRDRYGLDTLEGVPCVGDSRRDLDPGASLGCSPHLVLTGKGKNAALLGGLPKATRMHADLFSFSNFLIDGVTP